MTDSGASQRGPKFGRSATFLAVLGGGIVIVLGLLLGALLFRPDPISSLGGTGLSEIHTIGDEVYVGTIIEERNGYIRLRFPAKVILDPSSDATAPRLLVQLLSVDPFDMEEAVLLRADQVVLIGTVASGSGLEGAYHDAMSPSSTNPSPSQ